MDFLGGSEAISAWLMQYGSVALFFALVLGIIALPVPEETLMVIAGMLLYHDKLELVPILTSAYFGSICGITMSYLIGRTAGQYIIHKYGYRFGFTHERFEKVHAWFERFGTWVLFIGYFIPGVRHFTGFSAGMTGLHFSRFALFAYTGAITWVTTFLSIGYFFGTHWESTFESLEISLDQIIVLGVFVFCCAMAYKYLKKKWPNTHKAHNNTNYK